MPRKSKLIPEDTLENTVEIIKTLGHHDRLQIVNILLRGECHVRILADKLNIGHAFASQQLIILKMHGVLKSRREANKVYYSIANDNIKRIVETIKTEIK